MPQRFFGGSVHGQNICECAIAALAGCRRPREIPAWRQAAMALLNAFGSMQHAQAQSLSVLSSNVKWHAATQIADPGKVSSAFQATQRPAEEADAEDLSRRRVSGILVSRAPWQEAA